MKQALHYIIQVIFASGLLYGYYHFFLRNKKFHRYNRFYLLFATAISLVIPFLDIPVYFSDEQTRSSVILQTLTSFSDPVVITHTSGTTANEHTSFLHSINWPLTLYITVVCIILLRIVISVAKLKRITRNNPSQKIDRILFIDTDEPGTPFSFFNWLFWNREIQLQSAKGEQVFRHEYFHIAQKHSADVLFMELVNAFCWFNPFFCLMKKELKAIHEFLADQYAVTDNTRWEYAELLLMRAMDTHQSLVNPFFHNQIKRRIAMITTSQQPGHQYLRKLMVLPLVAIATLLFAFTYKTRNAGIHTLPGNVTDTVPGHTMKGFLYEKQDKIMIEADSVIVKSKPEKKGVTSAKDVLLIVNGIKTKYPDFIAKTYFAKTIEIYGENDPEAIKLFGNEAKNGVMILKNARIVNTPMREYYKAELTDISEKNGQADKVFDKVDISPAFPGGMDKWKLYLQKNLDASVPVKNRAPDGAYTVVVQFIVDLDGNISNVRTLTHHGYGMEEEAMRVIKSGPKWLPAIQNGKTVKAYHKQPVTFVVGKGDKNYKETTKLTENDLNEIVVVSFDQQAIFPGGQEAWKNFLTKNIRSLVPVDSGAKAGQYKTVVQFIVHEDGSLTDFKALSKNGFGMENEVIRLLKSGPAWIPAESGGKKVSSYVQQPVTFVVTEDNDEGSPSNTSPGTTTISVTEIKKALPYQLLQLTKETEIAGYMFTTDLENGTISESYNKGNAFNEATSRLIAAIRPGRLVTIDRIKVVKDGKEIRLPSKVYEVTN